MAIFGKSNQINYDSYDMETLANLIESSNNFRGKASADMDDVHNALKVVNAFHKNRVDKNDLKDFLAAQDNLINACKNYIDKKGDKHHRSVGKDRLNIVSAIYNIAKDENFRDISFSDIEGKTWGDVRSDARTIRKTIANNATINSEGANTSVRNVFEEGYFTQSYITTKDENLIFNQAFDRLMSNQRKILSPYRKDLSKITEYLTGYSENDTREHVFSISAINKLPDNKKEEVFNLIRTDLGSNINSIRNGKNYTNNAAAPMGIDPTMHNVATSRLADIFNANDIIPKSQKMTFVENGVEHKGVVMAKATGLDLSKANEQEITDFIYADKKDPEFQRQLNKLSIMDMVAGQTDRHAKNMIYRIGKDADGKPVFKGVQGIDNDMAFGKLLLSSSAEDDTKPDKFLYGDLNAWKFRSNIGRVTDIQVIDEKTFDSLKHITRDDLQYMFSDTLSEECLSAMQGRINQIIEHVEKDNVLITDKFDDKTYELMQTCPTMFAVDKAQKDRILEREKEAKRQADAEAKKKAAEEAKKKAAEEAEKKADEEPKKEQAAEAPKRKPAPTAPKRVQTNFNELSKAGWRSQVPSTRDKKFTIGRDRTQKPAAKKPSGPSMD